MRAISQKIIAGSFAFTIMSLLTNVVTFAQSYRYDFDEFDYAADAAAGSAFFGGLTIFYICLCCISLIVPIVCAVIVYKDANKNSIENAVIWALVSFFFPIIGILIYFLAIKPDAMKKQQSGVAGVVNQVQQKVEEKVEEVKESVQK